MELSIIVPIYNVEDYLEECLESLYNIKNIEKYVVKSRDFKNHKIWYAKK